MLRCVTSPAFLYSPLSILPSILPLHSPLNPLKLPRSLTPAWWHARTCDGLCAQHGERGEEILVSERDEPILLLEHFCTSHLLIFVVSPLLFHRVFPSLIVNHYSFLYALWWSPSFA